MHQKCINQADLWKEDKLFKFYVPLTNEHLMLIYFLSVYERIRNQKRLFPIHCNIYNVLVEWIQDGHFKVQNIGHLNFWYHHSTKNKKNQYALYNYRYNANVHKCTDIYIYIYLYIAIADFDWWSTFCSYKTFEWHGSM